MVHGAKERGAVLLAPSDQEVVPKRIELVSDQSPQTVAQNEVPADIVGVYMARRNLREAQKDVRVGGQ